MPRDNGDFFKGLRDEIAAKQLRRTVYIRMKLTFIIGLFGIGSLSIAGSPTKSLFYLITLVVLIFDLYIIGEDFTIKRAGMFLQCNPDVPQEERRWEKIVFANRNPVGGVAALLSSMFVLIPAGIVLWNPKGNGMFYWAWVGASSFVIIGTWIYSHCLLMKLKKLRKDLNKEFPEATCYTEPL